MFPTAAPPAIGQSDAGVPLREFKLRVIKPLQNPPNSSQSVFGRFILADNATINLAGNASRLSFADSSGETWAEGRTLIISNWNGNLSGGGPEQLKFGSSQSGLTPQQLSHIRFRAAYPPDLYTAKLLTTGEVVPDQLIPPSLASSRQGKLSCSHGLPDGFFKARPTCPVHSSMYPALLTPTPMT